MDAWRLTQIYRNISLMLKLDIFSFSLFSSYYFFLCVKNNLSTKVAWTTKYWGVGCTDHGVHIFFSVYHPFLTSCSQSLKKACPACPPRYKEAWFGKYKGFPSFVNICKNQFNNKHILLNNSFQTRGNIALFCALCDSNMLLRGGGVYIILF